MGISDFIKNLGMAKPKIVMPSDKGKVSLKPNYSGYKKTEIIPEPVELNPTKSITINGKTYSYTPSKKSEVRWKSGGFPFYRDENGKIWVCLFKSNNPHYGSKDYQMPKGHPDPNESPGDVAAREVMEETGIPERILSANRRKVGKFNFKGEVNDYIQYVYMFPLDIKFPATTNNEGMGKWVNYEYALTVLRKDQRGFLKKSREEFVKYEKDNRSS